MSKRWPDSVAVAHSDTKASSGSDTQNPEDWGGGAVRGPSARPSMTRARGSRLLH